VVGDPEHAVGVAAPGGIAAASDLIEQRWDAKWVPGHKELVWADGNHFDYYDSPGQIDNAVATPPGSSARTSPRVRPSDAWAGQGAAPPVTPELFRFFRTG
jgi:hypothetical protein